jgi:ArsR family transcriptional regulator, lead/cadmium/zinc/bismuth-responsive transcriptional repressor
MKCHPYHIFFRNLGNPLRVKIISELKQKPSSVNQLSEKLNIEQSKLSHALSQLKHCNLVISEKKGKQRIYSLNKKTILPILKLIDEHAKEFCMNKDCEKHCKKNENKLKKLKTNNKKELK